MIDAARPTPHRHRAVAGFLPPTSLTRADASRPPTSLTTRGGALRVPQLGIFQLEPDRILLWRFLLHVDPQAVIGERLQNRHLVTDRNPRPRLRRRCPRHHGQDEATPLCDQPHGVWNAGLLWLQACLPAANSHPFAAVDPTRAPRPVDLPTRWSTAATPKPASSRDRALPSLPTISAGAPARSRGRAGKSNTCLTLGGTALAAGVSPQRQTHR